MKKPTIASDIGGIPELIQHNKTGLLVKNGDAENISENILKLINNPSYAQEIAESGYQIIKKEFSWNRLSEKFSEIIYNYKRDYAK
jgi:glycosyltransferase involved in cell wall biosynthesis